MSGRDGRNKQSGYSYWVVGEPRREARGESGCVLRCVVKTFSFIHTHDKFYWGA